MVWIFVCTKELAIIKDKSNIERFLCIVENKFDTIDNKKHRQISASTDVGPRSRVVARETLRSAPHRH